MRQPLSKNCPRYCKILLINIHENERGNAECQVKSGS